MSDPLFSNPKTFTSTSLIPVAGGSSSVVTGQKVLTKSLSQVEMEEKKKKGCVSGVPLIIHSRP